VSPPALTPEQVDAALPALRHLFGQVYAQMADLVKLRGTLEEAGLPSAPDELAPLPLPDDMERLKRRYLRAIADVADLLRRVGKLGGILRDLEVGLVDFPGVWEGRPVYFCWRYGEPVVAHFHGRDEGYGERRPLGGGRTAMLDVQRN